MSKDSITMQVTLPKELGERIKKLAKHENRSNSNMLNKIITKWFFMKDLLLGDKNDKY